MVFMCFPSSTLQSYSLFKFIYFQYIGYFNEKTNKSIFETIPHGMT